MTPTAHTAKHPAPSSHRTSKVAHPPKPATTTHGAPAPKVVHVVKAGTKAGAAVHVPKQVSGRYLEAIGRRKTAVVQVRIYESGDAVKPGIVVNGRPFATYFPAERQRRTALAPLVGASLSPEDLSVSARAAGGGSYAQAAALALALARALVKQDPLRRSRLKALGLLSRDSRMVEAKKFGSRKARRPQQWRKR